MTKKEKRELERRRAANLAAKRERKQKVLETNVLAHRIEETKERAEKMEAELAALQAGKPVEIVADSHGRPRYKVDPDAVREGELISAHAPEPPEIPFDIRSAEGEAEFLKELEANGGVIEWACRAVGVSTGSLYAWRRKNEQFRLRMAAAVEQGTTKLESECARRAMDGSDTLMMFLLKSRKPNVYRERYDFNHTVRKGDERTYTEEELIAIVNASGDGVAESEEGTLRLPELH